MEAAIETIAPDDAHCAQSPAGMLLIIRPFCSISFASPFLLLRLRFPTSRKSAPGQTKLPTYRIISALIGLYILARLLLLYTDT